MGRARYGLFGDLSLGFIDACVGVWIYRAADSAAYAGIIGGPVGAFTNRDRCFSSRNASCGT
jgi:uncharacterized membrane protein YeaQ/YmgE (transglycosylase-associated protein family)